MGINILPRKCLTSLTNARCAHRIPRNWHELPNPRSTRLLSLCFHYSTGNRKLFSNKISPTRQISPDFFMDNRKEIISRINQIDFSRTLTRPFKNAAKDADTPKYSVFIPFCIANGEPSVLFTLRSSELTSHRGQVSFPGGRMDNTDVDATHTALREMEEELGIPESCTDVWGEVLPSLSRTLDYIHVIAGFVKDFEALDVNINQDEVESIFTMSLRHLCDPQNRSFTIFDRGSVVYHTTAFLGGEHRVWGLSAGMLDSGLSVILPGDYTTTREHFGLQAVFGSSAYYRH